MPGSIPIPVLFFLAASAAAGPAAGPAEDWRLESFFVPREGLRKGDEVVSTDADIDGDGTPERLVTLRKGSRNAKAGNIWGVYTRDKDGFRFRGHITFRIDRAVLAVIPEVSPRKRLYSPRNGAVMSYSVSGGRVHETDEAGISLDAFHSAAARGERPIYRQTAAAGLSGRYRPEDLEGVLAGADGRRSSSRRPPGTAGSLPQQSEIAGETSGGAKKVSAAGAAGAILLAGFVYVVLRNGSIFRRG